MPTTFATPDSLKIREIFTAITPKYDFLNTLLSMGLDRGWRAWAVKKAIRGSEETILDIGTGTGKFLERFVKAHPFKQAIGLDLCESMLGVAKRSVALQQTSWIAGNVTGGLPLKEGSVDLVTAAFTLRSIRDLNPFFAAVHAGLKADGRVVFLELTRPRYRWLSWLYYPYLKFYLPAVGTLFSKSKKAYRFLSESIMHFSDPEQVKSTLEEVGFKKVSIYPFTGGIATLIIGDKA